MSTPDAYEREHMEGRGAVLHRQRVAAPRWALGLTAGLPVAITAVASAALAIAGLPAVTLIAPLVAGALSSTIITTLLVVFAVGRVAISEGEVHLQVGPTGPRIPIDEIERCELVDSGLVTRGLGVRTHVDGTTYYRMMGDPARAVRIEQRGRRGAIVLVCPDPEAVVTAIQEARRRAGPRVRVEADAEADAEAEVVSAHEPTSRRDRSAKPG